MTRYINPSLLGLLIAMAGCSVGDPDDTLGDDDEIVDDTDDTDAPPIPEDEILITEATAPSLIDSSELHFINKLNELRKSKGLPALRVSIGLTKAANAQIKKMQAADKVLAASASLIGTYYPYATKAQTVGTFTPTPVSPPSPFAMWKNAGGAKLANMLSTTSTVIGIARGIATPGESPSTDYWIVIYGGTRDAILSAGTTTIASNGSFETNPKVDPTTGESTVGVKFSAVNKTNRWYLYSDLKGADSFTVWDTLTGAYAGESMLTVVHGEDAISVTQMVKAAPGVNYRVTARVMDMDIFAEESQYLYLEFVNKDFQRLFVKRVEANQQANQFWKLVTVQDVAPAGTAFVRTFIYGAPGTGMGSSFGWDDIRVTAF